ncbi:phage/plasmid primase, P4 family [Streptomyces sp. NPDC002044]|uniref:DNA primase family protein n=1 Tax=Streptomyces sp. NPDC002044 TaxID=3154662 RepID=UPI0033292908
MTTEAEATAFIAFQRDRARKAKAEDAMKAADVAERAAFEQWQKEQANKTQKEVPARNHTGGTETTDAILAERVSARVLNGSYCWSAGLGWMRWTGTHWERSNQQTITETVRQYMVEAVSDELRAPDTDWRKRQELMSLLSKSRLVALVELSKGILQVRDDMFDSRPDLLNTLSGVVHLGTGKVRAHDPHLYLTKITAAAYRPGATHRDWTAALEALPEEVREWFQTRAGQAITGHMTPDDVLMLLQGGGENGKSTVLESISRAIGKGYGVLMSDRVLLADPGSHPTELMDLRGARFAMAEELPERGRLNVKRLKDVIGTSTMKARYMKQDTTEWSSTHSVFLSTNYLPTVEETDHGTWRRLVLVSFPYKFVKPGVTPSGPRERQGDPGIRERLKHGREQHEAVLAWLVEGAKRWYSDERVMPPLPALVERDTQDWRADCDLVLKYWRDRIEPDTDSHVMARELFSDFNTWLQSQEHARWSDKTFGARFGGHDETSARRAERRKIKARPGLSRPESVVSSFNHVPVPAAYWAWLGVRFTKDGLRMDEICD